MKSKFNLIYNKIDKFISKYKSNNLLYIMLFCIVILANLKNSFFDLLAILLLSIMVLIMKPEEIVYSYIFLFFFEIVAEISIIGGSINRIVLMLGTIKILYYLFKEKIKIKKESIFITIFWSFFLVYSLIIDKSNRLDNIVLYINFMFFLLYSMYLSTYNIEQKKKIINELLNTIVTGAFFSIIYGLIFWNFELEHRTGFNNWRFNGTNDSNFLAYYINLAVIIQIFRKLPNLKKDKIINIIINIFLFVGLILTKSITGIFINIVSFIILIFIKNKTKIKTFIHYKKKEVIIIMSLLLIVLGIGLFVLVQKNINEVYKDSSENIVAKNRVADIILSIKKGDLDRLTSQKTRDWRLFINDFKESSIVNKMFGKGIDTYLIYSSYFNKNVASHSTYIDFLCCYGIIGMIFIMWYIFQKLKNNIILSSCINNEVYKYLRIILLIYAIELNIYTNRVFLLMFLL